MTYKSFIPLALLAACGCISVRSGDILVERETMASMMEDKSIKPFSQIDVSWMNYPYRGPTDSIGEGSVSNPKKIMPVPVEYNDMNSFRKEVKETLSEAGLYDPVKGSGKIKIDMLSFGKWTYRDLFSSYLVDTGFIFILPSSLKVNYYITAECQTSTGTAKIEVLGQHKTIFHLLMAPLYPFSSPSSKEHGLINQMLWRAATDIYSALKKAEAEKTSKEAAAKASAAQNPQQTQPPPTQTVSPDEQADD